MRGPRRNVHSRASDRPPHSDPVIGRNAQIAAIPGRLGERVKSGVRSPIEVQNGRVERNARLWAPSRSRSTGSHRVCKTGGPGATPRGQGLTELVHVDEDDWRGEER